MYTKKISRLVPFRAYEFGCTIWLFVVRNTAFLFSSLFFSLYSFLAAVDISLVLSIPSGFTKAITSNFKLYPNWKYELAFFVEWKNWHLCIRSRFVVVQKSLFELQVIDEISEQLINPPAMYDGVDIKCMHNEMKKMNVFSSIFILILLKITSFVQFLNLC